MRARAAVKQQRQSQQLRPAAGEEVAEIPMRLNRRPVSSKDQLKSKDAQIHLLTQKVHKLNKRLTTLRKAAQATTIVKKSATAPVAKRKKSVPTACANCATFEARIAELSAELQEREKKHLMKLQEQEDKYHIKVDTLKNQVADKVLVLKQMGRDIDRLTGELRDNAKRHESMVLSLSEKVAQSCDKEEKLMHELRIKSGEAQMLYEKVVALTRMMDFLKRDHAGQLSLT